MILLVSRMDVDLTTNDSGATVGAPKDLASRKWNPSVVFLSCGLFFIVLFLVIVLAGKPSPDHLKKLKRDTTPKSISFLKKSRFPSLKIVDSNPIEPVLKKTPKKPIYPLFAGNDEEDPDLVEDQDPQFAENDLEDLDPTEDLSDRAEDLPDPEDPKVDLGDPTEADPGDPTPTEDAGAEDDSRAQEPGQLGHDEDP